MILKKRLYKLGGFQFYPIFFSFSYNSDFHTSSAFSSYSIFLLFPSFSIFSSLASLPNFLSSPQLELASLSHKTFPFYSVFFRIPTKMKSILSISFLLGSLVSTISSTSEGTVTFRASLTSLTSHEPKNYVDITVPFEVFRPLENRKAFLHGRFL